MTHGKHVSPSDCDEMREMVEKGYFAKIVAEKFDVSVHTVYYHVRGRCIHNDR